MPNTPCHYHWGLFLAVSLVSSRIIREYHLWTLARPALSIRTKYYTRPSKRAFGQIRSRYQTPSQSADCLLPLTCSPTSKVSRETRDISGEISSMCANQLARLSRAIEWFTEVDEEINRSRARAGDSPDDRDDDDDGDGVDDCGLRAPTSIQN